MSIYECRSDERLNTKVEESTRLAHTGLLGELEHLKMTSRWRRCVYFGEGDERFFFCES
jgi:hypothetical protein